MQSTISSGRNLGDRRRMIAAMPHSAASAATSIQRRRVARATAWTSRSSDLRACASSAGETPAARWLVEHVSRLPEISAATPGVTRTGDGADSVESTRRDDSRDPSPRPSAGLDMGAA